MDSRRTDCPGRAWLPAGAVACLIDWTLIVTGLIIWAAVALTGIYDVLVFLFLIQS